ncbi:hypothetical protein B0H17DRAFT_1051956 [Mycena rosella]|uniref:BTB domain-containing protein n=1 Tax=Mycena rosella TaxID=1033263 RepID=A0AAD7DSL0_MYCRO|nr:hypothetical protein B0H17DRAFT_1051956 [Mycena rosella]
MDYRICFLRVEDHIFQIHFFHLLRDESSAFHDMLHIPSGGCSPQGFSRDEPITLTGDLLDELRAFHALAYTSLDQLASPLKTADLPRMLNAGLFAHKYSLISFRDFALRTIQQIGATFTLNSFPANIMHDLLRLTWLCGPDRYNAQGTDEFIIRSFVRSGWISDLNANPSAKNLAQKIASAAEFDYRPLIGDIYHVYLLQITNKKGPKHTPGPIPFPDSEMFDLHRSRLLAGYWSLTQCWARFAEAAPPLPSTNTCQRPSHHQTRCAEAWVSQWEWAATQPEVMAIQSLDIIPKLFAFHAALARASDTCSSSFVKTAVAEYICASKESLADHFLGPLPLV